MVDALQAQLSALRAALATAVAQVESCLVLIQQIEVSTPPCGHRHTTNYGTIGAPVMVCEDCGATLAIDESNENSH